MKGIKLSKYFEIIHPKYIYLQLTPNNSIKNNSTDRIAKSIASLHKGLTHHIKVEEGKLFKIPFLKRQRLWATKYSLEMSSKVSYFIYVEKKNVEKVNVRILFYHSITFFIQY